jgi:hypothetical protein
MNQQQNSSASVSGAVGADALSSMFQCIAGLKNLRAAGAMMTCFVAGILLAGLLGLAGGQPSFGRAGIGAVLFALCFFTGIHSAGVLLMDQARGVPLRSVTEALVYALVCVPRTIILIIGLALAAVAVYVLLAVLFFLCKIPGLGYLLFAVVFPVAVIAAGLTGTALLLGFQMALASIWEGASITRALAQTVAILRSRLVETVVLLAIVVVLAGIVSALVFSVLLFGFWPAVGMAATIVGVGNFGDLTSMLPGLMSGGGYALAGAIGGGVLWALALTLTFQVGLLGVNLVYLRVSEGLDASATQAAMLSHLEDARRRAVEVGHKAKEAAERARAQAEQAAAKRRAAQVQAPVPAAPIVATNCPKCGTAITQDDVFCASCGHKLT